MDQRDELDVQVLTREGIPLDAWIDDADGRWLPLVSLVEGFDLVMEDVRPHVRRLPPNQRRVISFQRPEETQIATALQAGMGNHPPTPNAPHPASADDTTATHGDPTTPICISASGAPGITPPRRMARRVLTVDRWKGGLL